MNRSLLGLLAVSALVLAIVLVIGPSHEDGVSAGAPPTSTVTPTKLPDPGDTDGDGCSDQQENGPDEFLGGGRDFLNPWDYFNPSKDGYNRMDDVLGVIEHFSPGGLPPYDVQYDRSPGSPIWLTQAPTGRIDLDNIFAILWSWHHDCATAPPGPPPPASAGLAFSIGVHTGGSPADDCDTSGGPTTCILTPGAVFTLNYYLDSLPDGVSSYLALETSVVFNGVITEDVPNIVSRWPDCSAFTAFGVSGAGQEAAACSTGLFLPLPASTYTGLIATSDFTCDVDGQISLEHGEIDTALYEDSATLHIEGGGSKETLTIDCGVPGPTPTPTDTPTPTPTPTPKQPDGDGDGDTIPNSVDLDDDNDGCTDEQENGQDETLGGLRNPHNPHDFYDVLGPGAALPIDGVIDLPNDILGVIVRFSPSGGPPYDVQFDRGPSTGPNSWNMTAPDGVIDLPNDILGVILQFQHSCA